jgi:hypothetical protein
VGGNWLTLGWMGSLLLRSFWLLLLYFSLLLCLKKNELLLLLLLVLELLLVLLLSIEVFVAAAGCSCFPDSCCPGPGTDCLDSYF